MADGVAIVPISQLENSPSRLDGIKAEDEKTYRDKSCFFIEELGMRLAFSKKYAAPFGFVS